MSAPDIELVRAVSRAELRGKRLAKAFQALIDFACGHGCGRDHQDRARHVPECRAAKRALAQFTSQGGGR